MGFRASLKINKEKEEEEYEGLFLITLTTFVQEHIQTLLLYAFRIFRGCSSMEFSICFSKINLLGLKRRDINDQRNLS